MGAKKITLGAVYEMCRSDEIDPDLALAALPVLRIDDPAECARSAVGIMNGVSCYLRTLSMGDDEEAYEADVFGARLRLPNGFEVRCFSKHDEAGMDAFMDILNPDGKSLSFAERGGFMDHEDEDDILSSLEDGFREWEAKELMEASQTGKGRPARRI